MFGTPILMFAGWLLLSWFGGRAPRVGETVDAIVSRFGAPSSRRQHDGAEYLSFWDKRSDTAYLVKTENGRAVEVTAASR